MLNRTYPITIAVLGIACVLSACTDSGDQKNEFQPDPVEQSGKSLTDPDLQTALEAVNAHVAATNAPAFRRLSYENGRWEVGAIQDGLSPGLESGDMVPEARWIVDCHDRASGDILSSTEADSLDGLQAALNAHNRADRYVHLCSGEIAAAPK